MLLPFLPVYVPPYPPPVRLLLAAVLFIAYIIAKPFHMLLLYRNANQVIAEIDTKTGRKKYSTDDLPNGVRLFFWKGRLVSSATRAT